MSGKVPPGLSLRLNDLARELGVSTTPVRMALERLAADGFVIQENRRTCKVAPLSTSDFQDIYAVRRCLEGAAARLGTQRLTNEDIDAMRMCLNMIEEIVSDRDPDVDLYLKTEWDMHEVCYRASDNPRLFRETQAYRRQAERYFHLVLTEGGSLLDDLQGQRDFYLACSTRDHSLAEVVAVRMLDWTVERMVPTFAAIEQRRGTTV